MPIAVVTDSTAYLPEGWAEQFAVRTVPLQVNVGGAGAVAESDFTPRELTRALERKQRVTTSGAASEELAKAYQAALDDGADGVVAVHLSRQLSATWDAARLAAREVDPQRIRVVDSRSAAMGLGFPVLAAADAARRGADLDEVEHTAIATAGQTTTLFLVQTLEHLRRGGRIGTAAAVLGTALAIKPVLHVREGRIEVLEKVRTTSRAMDRMLQAALRSAGTGRAAVAVHHLAAADRAQELADQLQERLGNSVSCQISEVGAVIGAHIGPGAVGVVVLPGGWRVPE